MTKSKAPTTKIVAPKTKGKTPSTQSKKSSTKAVKSPYRPIVKIDKKRDRAQSQDEMLDDVLAYTKDKDSMRKKRMEKFKKQGAEFHEEEKKKRMEKDMEAKRLEERQERKRIAERYLAQQKKREELMKMKTHLKSKYTSRFSPNHMQALHSCFNFKPLTPLPRRYLQVFSMLSTRMVATVLQRQNF